MVLFGIRCAFTNVVAATLCRLGYVPSALILPGPASLDRPLTVASPSRALPMMGGPTGAAAEDWPVFQVGRLSSPETIALIESLAPDVLLVACFPRLIPSAIREIARLRALNIHPSLLPRHRGPDPLFWIMRAGGKGFGVTIHELSDRFDAGDILAQKSLPYPAGAAESELEPTVAAAGAMLAATVVTRLATGSVERTPQDPRLATYESWPEESDYVISTSRPARDAFVFLRGVAGRGIPVRIDAPDGSILVTDAIDFAGDPEPTPTDDPDLTVIPFQPGWLVARVKASACR